MIPLNQKTILIVEDDFILAKMGQKTLEQCGYRSIVANTGEEAIDIFEKTNTIDLILMDIDLGSGIDGTEAAAIILKKFDIPVVFLSSHTEPEIVEKTEKITSYGYVVKGTGITVLDASIKMAFKLFDSRKKELEKEKALSLRKSYLSAIIENQPGLLWLKDLDGRFLSVNMEFAKSCGFDNSELLVGKTDMDIWPQELAVKYIADDDRVMKSGKPCTIEEPISDKGNIKWFETFKTPVFDNQGAIVGTTGYARDITERKKSDEILKQNESLLRRLVDILQHQSDSLQDFLDYALDQAIELTESKIGYIYHYHEERKEFVLNTWSKDVMADCSIINPSTCYELDKTGIWGEAVRQRRPIIVNDFQSENPLKKGYPKGHVKLTKFMTIPVFIGDKIVGVVGLANKISDYNETDVLQASLLMEAVWKVTTKMKAEDALRESEEIHSREASLLTTLLENLPVGVFLVDSNNGKPLVSNKAACRLLGRGILPDASKNNLAEVYKAFKQNTGKPYPLEEMPIILGMQGKSSHVEDMLVVRPDGTETLLEIFGCPIIDKQGKPWASLVSFQDITERKRVEESLSKSEARFRTLFEKANDGIIILSVDLEIIKINESFAEMHGYTIEEMKNIKLHNLDVEDLSQKAPDRIRRIMAGENLRFDVKHYHKDGHVIDLDVSSCLLTLKNENYIVAFHRDITDRKVSEDKIKDLLSEKELLLKEVHHRIKNNMDTVAGIISLQIESLKEPSLIAALNDARSRVTSTMMLYDKLYRSDDLKELSFKEYISPLVDEIVGNFPNRSIVRIEKNIDDFMIETKTMSHLGIIINELLTNIMKYAFTGKDNGLVKIAALKKDDHTTIIVQDNGIGTPISVNIHHSDGFGLQLVDMMVKQLRGTLKIERNNGTKFILEF